MGTTSVISGGAAAPFVFDSASGGLKVDVVAGGSASNASVGLTGATAPTSATEIGIIDSGGKLQGASSANPIRIDPTGTTTQPVEINDGTNVMGIMAKFGTTPGAVYALNTNSSIFAGTTALSATGSSLNVNITGGGSGGTQYTDETAESAGAFTITVAGLWNGTDVVGLRGDASNNLLTKINVALPAGTNVIGHVIVDSGTITAVTAITNALPAGSNLIGQVEVSDGTNVLFTSTHPGYIQGTVSIGSGPFAVTQSTSPWIIAGGGTAGAPGTAVLTVQGISGGTAIPVSGTFFQTTQPISIASGQVASGAFASGSIASGAIASGAIASGAIASGAIAAGAAAAGAFADGSVYVRSNAASTFPVTATIAASQTIAVTQTTASSLNATVVGTLTNNNAAPSTTNVGALAVLANAAAPTWTEGDQVLLSADLAGNQRVILHAETTKVIGTVNQGTSPWVETAVPAASGGCSTNIQTALSDTFEEVKSSAGQLYGYSIFNPNAGTVYVAWGNNASASFTSATDLFYIIGIPAGAAANVFFAAGIAGGGNSIYVAASTSATSGAAPASGLIVTTIYT